MMGIGKGPSLEKIPTISLDFLQNNYRESFSNAFTYFHTRLTSRENPEDVKIYRDALLNLERINTLDIEEVDKGVVHFGGFPAIVRSGEDYLLGFAEPNRIGLCVEVFDAISRSPTLSDDEKKLVLAEYIFHVLIGSWHLGDERRRKERYEGIQRRLFGSENKLKTILRGVIEAKLAEAPATQQASASVIALGKGTSLRERPSNFPISEIDPRIARFGKEVMDYMGTLPGLNVEKNWPIIKPIMDHINERQAHSREPWVLAFSVIVKSGEDYLLGYATPKQVSLGIEVLEAILDSSDLPIQQDKLHVAAEYIFHEFYSSANPEKSEEERQTRISGIQRDIFGQENRLKPILRKVIADKLAEQAPIEDTSEPAQPGRRNKHSLPNLLHALRAVVAGEVMTPGLELTWKTYQSESEKGALGPKRSIPRWTATNELDGLAKFGVLEKTGRRNFYSVAPWLKKAIESKTTITITKGSDSSSEVHIKIQNNSSSM
jgi:hypothetical protein